MSEEYNRMDFDKYMVPCFSPAPFIPIRAKGSWVWDQNGKDYIDLAGGIAVNSLGHVNKYLKKALKQQLDKLWHIGNGYTNEPVLQLAKTLVESTFADKIFFCNSGAEANEAALKLSLKYAANFYGKKKNEIIAFNDAFHGRTLFTVTVGGQPQYSAEYISLFANIIHLPYNNLQAVSSHISEHTCAIIVEPVIGEGGVYPADPIFLQGLRRLCNHFNVALIFDEVQTGAGRTGSLYAYQQYNVEPDILTSAKGLGGGFPIGAMLVKENWAQVFTLGTHGTTFGGNPMAATVANSVLGLLDNKLFEGVKQRNVWIIKKLSLLQEKYSIFKDLRSMGLLIGAELSMHWKGKAKILTNFAAEEGVITLIAGPNVIRFTPALNICFRDLQEAFIRFERALIRLKNS
ncbi:bifunctional succinylornithine transaminase/acetylornithine transaminase [Candidatus Pantoea carbekii]|uniref:bifunctional succinylornithine transaminase/acetylornithine transaminase n=1 Tax=Candidatus Pantoea carbekii TaxID=1235990 RepID=UPI0006187577|nr:bifunctional succinylornithine transaminase/acetylornithine transaminase [Candidatus Pantoea carbekii]AKC32608.1 succinylornithine transaminase atsC [Candidatus Pantoea carbekii]